jgi:leucyl aminopeptidase
MFFGIGIDASKMWIVPHGASTVRRSMAGACFVVTITRTFVHLKFRVTMRNDPAVQNIPSSTATKPADVIMR